MVLFIFYTHKFICLVSYEVGQGEGKGPHVGLRSPSSETVTSCDTFPREANTKLIIFTHVVQPEMTFWTVSSNKFRNFF